VGIPVAGPEDRVDDENCSIGKGAYFFLTLCELRWLELGLPDGTYYDYIVGRFSKIWKSAVLE